MRAVDLGQSIGADAASKLTWIENALREIERASNEDALTASGFSAADAATARANLGLGSPGTALALSAKRTTDQIVTSTTWTKAQLDTEVTDPNNWFDNVTNYRFLPNQSGIYLTIGQVIPAADDTKLGGVALYVNGSAVRKLTLASGASTFPILSCSELISLNGSTDYIELYGFSQAASPKLLGSSTDFSSLTIFKVA